jgi:hypothetical protein
LLTLPSSLAVYSSSKNPVFQAFRGSQKRLHPSKQFPGQLYSHDFMRLIRVPHRLEIDILSIRSDLHQAV